MAAVHIEYGRHGEELAAEWYARRGYSVLERNWRCPIGEIDLIARRGRLVVFCEVKARRSAAVVLPAMAVGPVKQQRLRRLAAAWLATHRFRRGVEVRFDVVAVTGSVVDVYENAF
jgi:putative endonuclease